MLPAPSWLRFGKSRGQQQQQQETNKRNRPRQSPETPALEPCQSAPQRSCAQPEAPARTGTGTARHNLPALRRSLTNLLQRLVGSSGSSASSTSSSQQQQHHQPAVGCCQSSTSRAPRRKRRGQDQVTNEPSKEARREERASGTSGLVGGSRVSAEPTERKTTTTTTSISTSKKEPRAAAAASAAGQKDARASNAAVEVSRGSVTSTSATAAEAVSPRPLPRRSPPRPVIDRCHLTARTTDNQCALHGETPEAAISGSGSIATNATQQQQQQQRPVGQAVELACQPAHKVVIRSPAGVSSSSAAQSSRPECDTMSAKRPPRKKRSTPQATWPLVKQTLNLNSSYGDCEDILSPHLLANRTNLAQQSTWTRRALDQVSSLSQQSNADHKRPFGQPFERPSAGWIYNAISAHKINIGEGLKAKLFAAGGFRRGSYDDQEGDNDINIILQPSDLHDIEKRARLNIAAFGTKTLATSGLRTKSTITNHAYNNNNNNNDYHYYSYNNDPTDLKLAKCLLDQDYNLTVRLFIGKSALNWNFNSFTFDALCCGRSLTELLLHLFDFYDLYNIFNLDIVNVLKCFRLLEFGYHSTNPYHNSIHAADVTQAMHCFIQEKKIRKHMTHLETLCSILAAVCHDLDHPGVSQSFLVATNNPLASLYNNNSVLENHHWRFALCIFKESQLFDHFTEDVFSQMKLQLKHLILATDIARQNEYLRRFRELTSSHNFSMQNPEDRSLVLQMALKCADLGNPCRSWLISRVWSNLICDEFYKMGQIERQLGIPLTPICQREKTSIAGIQTDFFRFIVLPLLELWHKFLESPLSSLLMSNFEHNYQRWQRANRIVQQLKRRKSVACIEPVEESENTTDSSDISGFCSRQPFASIKKASSDYIKSGNGSLESLRNFQLERIIEKSPLISRSRLAQEIKKKQQQQVQSISLTTKENTKSSARAKSQNQNPHNVHRRSEQKFAEQHHHKSSRCAQPVASQIRNMPTCSGHRKTLSPIEDGEASSPDLQQQQQQQRTFLRDAGSMTDPTPPNERPSSSSSDSSLISRASSACSSPVIRRSMSSRTSIDRSICASAHPQHIKSSQQQHQQQRNHPSLPQYYDASGQSMGLYSNKRRESDPGCCTNKYELAAAIVLIQFQNNPLYHRRRSSLPVCVPKRRSSS